MNLDSLQLEQRHDRFHLGHTFMVFGVFSALLLSLLLSAIPTGRALAFGTSDVAVLSNQSRNNNGIASLVLNAKLATAAQAKANHMVSNNYFEHTAPDGTTGWYFIGQQGYAYTMAGENLAATNESATAVVEGWMNSPGHRANLLNANFSEVGYGISFQGSFQGYQDVYYVVALYAQPAATETVAASNNSQTTQATSSKGSAIASEQVSPPYETSNTIDTKSVSQESGVDDAISLTSNELPNIGLSGTTSGLSTTLSKSRFGITKSMSLAIAGLSAVLIVVGLWIEIARFIKHGPGIHTMRHSH